MVDVFRVDSMVFAIFPDIPLMFIPRQGLSHIKGIFRGTSARRVIAVITDDPPIHAIAVWQG